MEEWKPPSRECAKLVTGRAVLELREGPSMIVFATWLLGWPRCYDLYYLFLCPLCYNEAYSSRLLMSSCMYFNDNNEWIMFWPSVI